MSSELENAGQRRTLGSGELRLMGRVARMEEVMCYVFLGLSILWAGVSLLTTVKAPTVATWLLAVLAGEFGHFLVMLPVALVVWAVARGPEGNGVVFVATLALCAMAAGFFVKPAAQACGIAAKLPARLQNAFGKADVGRDAFSIKRFLAGAGEAVKAEARVFAYAGSAEALTLDFYRAQSGPAKAPCVIVVHGGGWDKGDRGQLPGLNSRLARAGYAVAAVSYRLAPKHIWPAQRDDVRSAVAYLKLHAAELGVDATRFVLLGRSAGGQIAEAVAYEGADPAVRGVVALYAPADLHFAWSHTPERDVLDSKKLMRQLTGGTPETAAENFERGSPYFYAKRGAVPTLLMHGTIDSLVWRRQSERLAERLSAEGVPNVFIELPWATHAFDFNPCGPSGQLSAFAIEWFLSAVTSGKPRVVESK
jgi:acetyl esterase/lipase